MLKIFPVPGSTSLSTTHPVFIAVSVAVFAAKFIATFISKSITFWLNRLGLVFNHSAQGIFTLEITGFYYV